MNEFVIKKLTKYFMTESMDSYEAEILEYGIATTVLNLPKSLLLIAIAMILGLTKPLMLIFLFYGMIRNFSRGIHAKTALGCFLVGTANYIGMAYLAKVITVPQKLYHAVYAYCFYVYYKYAPSGTEVNPVYPDQVMLLKKWSLIIILSYYIIGLKQQRGMIRNVGMLSVLSQSISILPVTYMISKQRGGIIHEEE